MKYLKQFENLNNDKYWRINFNSMLELTICLEKLGLIPNDDIYKDILTDKYILAIDDEDKKANGLSFRRIYVAKKITVMKEEFWEYSYDYNQFRGRCNYMGIIKAEKFEIISKKYNL